ncbi:MAG TPA: hypothetical protein IGS53_16715 [Leptolyngbyaceae cyanobacterium M33_DOE_097]|uniref:Uncharacterized protein n=1 Tax=Oscillatoriales cyanobacterium SpSt-418 TaxID=2282169 RepID=A0A7C3KGX7_9CYAN|nr:hypothetical protein [Leptolyngbyaceae cyanobacterium M33_DOE_097]
MGTLLRRLKRHFAFYTKSSSLVQTALVRAIALRNLRLTLPVPSISDQSVKLATRTVWLANHSKPTRTTLRGL